MCSQLGRDNASCPLCIGHTLNLCKGPSHADSRCWLCSATGARATGCNTCTAPLCALGSLPPWWLVCVCTKETSLRVARGSPEEQLLCTPHGCSLLYKSGQKEAHFTPQHSQREATATPNSPWAFAGKGPSQVLLFLCKIMLPSLFPALAYSLPEFACAELPIPLLNPKTHFCW